MVSTIGWKHRQDSPVEKHLNDPLVLPAVKGNSRQVASVEPCVVGLVLGVPERVDHSTRTTRRVAETLLAQVEAKLAKFLAAFLVSGGCSRSRAALQLEFGFASRT